jgi:hypothetical protein
MAARQVYDLEVTSRQQLQDILCRLRSDHDIILPTKEDEQLRAVQGRVGSCPAGKYVADRSPQTSLSRYGPWRTVSWNAWTWP